MACSDSGEISKMRTKNRLVLLVIFTLILFGCSTKIPVNSTVIKSPLGLYKSNTLQKFWLAIMSDQKYLLCSPEKCYPGIYQSVPANYGVILIDFYLSEFGQTISQLSHGKGETKQFYEAMKKLRLAEPRPNDLAFNLGNCDGIPCVGLGHSRAGVIFYKVENFDLFWKIKNSKD